MDFGEPGFTAGLLLDQWRSRSFSPASDAAVVENGDAMLGYAAVFQPGDLAFVHPAREGEGIGTRLLRWAEDRARPRGIFRQRVAAANGSGQAFLEASGYRRVRNVLCLAWSAHAPTPAEPLPEGINLEPVASEQDARDLHRADRLAFAQNPDYEPELFEAFFDEHLSHPDLHPASTRIARHGDQPAGFVVCRKSGPMGYIDLLAVAPAHRRRHLGRFLLAHALHTLRADGAQEVRLDVASDNPRALALYRGAGMTERHEVQVFEKPVR